MLIDDSRKTTNLKIWRVVLSLFWYSITHGIQENELDEVGLTTEPLTI